MKIAKDSSYIKYLNQYNVISINMQEFSMTNQRELEEFVGFNEEEVRDLCDS